MARTAIKIHTERHGKWLEVGLLFDHEIEPVDLKRCRKAFAEALHEVFVAKGTKLETIDFESKYQLPEEWESYPCNMGGRATILRGTVSTEQLQQFRGAFQRLLTATRKYNVMYQRRVVRHIPRTAR